MITLLLLFVAPIMLATTLLFDAIMALITIASPFIWLASKMGLIDLKNFGMGKTTQKRFNPKI